MIIGLTGTFGAGKGVVTEHLKSKGFAHFSSSQLLGELVEKEGNPKTRNFLGPMATRLQQEYPGGVVEKNYREKYSTGEMGDVVFESIHRQSEANFVKSVGGFIIGVDADLEVRYERTKLRNEGEKDRKDFNDFKEMSRVEEGGGGDASWDNNIREVINHADALIMNNGTVEELLVQIDAALEKFQKQ